MLEEDNLRISVLMYMLLAYSVHASIEPGLVEPVLTSKVDLPCKLGRDDDSSSKEKFDANVASTFRAINCTDECLLHLRRAPAVLYPLDIYRIYPRVKAASALENTRDNRWNDTTEEGTQSFALGLNRHGQRWRNVLPKWLDGR